VTVVESSAGVEADADELLASLRWELAKLRLTYLHVQGLDARRRLFAARDRVFALLTAIEDADVTVVGRAIELALGTAAQPSSDGLDASLTNAIDLWRDMPLEDLWTRVSEYSATTKAGIAEQIMLLTYLEAFLPDEPQGWSLDLVAALATVLESPVPADIFGACGRLARCGGDVTKTFSVEVAELALTALALVLDPEEG
jgi:hypothetical protein